MVPGKVECVTTINSINYNKLGIRVIPLLGITKIQHLADNLEAINVSLKEEDMKYINEIYLNNA